MQPYDFRLCCADYRPRLARKSEPALIRAASLKDAQIVSMQLHHPSARMAISDLLARADAQAGELSKAYVRARIGGFQCQIECEGFSMKS